MRWLFVHRVGPFSFADVVEIAFVLAFAVLMGLHDGMLLVWLLFGSMAAAGVTRTCEMMYGINYEEDEDDGY